MRQLFCTTILLSSLLHGCSGGGETPYSAPGIDTGSVSSNYQPDTTSEPAIGAATGAASGAPLDDTFDAVRFLHRATFGPRADDIDTLLRTGYADWLSMQLNLPPTFMLPSTRARQVIKNLWRKNIAPCNGQLTRRLLGPGFLHQAIEPV